MKITIDEAQRIVGKWAPIRQYAFSAFISMFYMLFRLNFTELPPELSPIHQSKQVNLVCAVIAILAGLIFFLVRAYIRIKIEGIAIIVNPLSRMEYDDYMFRLKYYVPVVLVIVVLELILLVFRFVV